MYKLKPNQFYLPSGALITERPILYQTEMIQANLEDRKTQTRRTTGLDQFNESPDEIDGFYWAVLLKGNQEIPGFLADFKNPQDKELFVKSPYGNPGDLLYARETWANLNSDFPTADPFLIFKADIDHPNQHGPVTWKPSIHMPKEASRIWAMIEEIRVERVQDISEADAKAEGVEEAIIYDESYPNDKSKSISFFKSYITDYWGAFGNIAGDREENHDAAKKSYQTLWISINGQASWDTNPWLWVIKYRILSKTGRPSMDIIEKNYLEVIGMEVSHA